MNASTALLLSLLAALTPLAAAANVPEDISQVQAAHEQVLASDPKNLDSLFVLALIHEKKHETQKALQMWQKYLAAETDPGKRAIAQKHIHLLSQ